MRVTHVYEKAKLKPLEHSSKENTLLKDLFPGLNKEVNRRWQADKHQEK